jgi:hypothetical protein
MDTTRSEETQQLARAIMETWSVILIVLTVAIVIMWYLTRRNTVNDSIIPKAAISMRTVDQTTAPGMDPNTGNPPPAPPPPPPASTNIAPRAQLLNAVQQSLTRAISPSAAMSHVPIVGAPVTAAVRAVTSTANRVTFGVTDKVNNTLAHVPVVGGALAAPGKAVTSVAKKLTSWF